MPNFKKFANGGIDDGNSSEFSSVRYRQERNTMVGSRIEKVWATDYARCETREDFEKYISKYSRYESNKYVLEAKSRIEALDAAEKSRFEKEKNVRRVNPDPIASGTGGSGIPPRYKIMKACMKAFAWIIIFVGAGLYSYNQYEREKNVTKENVVVTPDQIKDQEPHEEYTMQTHLQESHAVEPESEPQEIWLDCTICGATGRCQLCFGTGRCGVCGGGGQVFSVFYGDEVGAGRMTDCGNCGGSGRCPLCEGSGACIACHGLGKCKLDY